MRLPDFIGVGAPRCGTTWLSSLLSQHPGIYMNPNFKEIHFFDNNYERGLAWYSRFFKDQPPDKVCGEFTPSYMHLENGIQRIHQMKPDAKIIVVLRDPVQRAYSHYMQRKSFTRGLASLESIIEGNSKQLLDFGEYGRQLKEIYGFFPREQVHVIVFEEMVSAPQACLLGLMSFLGVEPIELDLDQAPKNALTDAHSFLVKRLIRGLQSLGRRYAIFDQLWFQIFPGRLIINRIRRWNQKALPEFKENMSPATQRILQDYYAEDTKQLEMLLGRTIDWVKADGP